jgi:hypothetical protein
MVMTHVELVSKARSLTCEDCGREDMREAVLVNQHGLVLLRGPVCAHCVHQRHRHSRQDRTAA